MKCESCNVEINAEFAHAIQNNQCPACGKSIMKQAQLASYLSLSVLIEENIKNVDAKKVAALIVANFEVKQIFKSATGNESIEVEEDDEPIIQDGIKLEKIDRNKRDKVLERLRDEALNEALADNGASLNGDQILLNDDGSIGQEYVNSMKRQQSQQTIESGLGNSSFKRSKI